MTIIEELKNNRVPEYFKDIAFYENLELNVLIDKIKEGKIVIPKNKNHNIKIPKAIGEGTHIKINANIGTSKNLNDFEFEKRKFIKAVENGADTIMLLSTWGDLKKQREYFINNFEIPFGTVPIYDLAHKAYLEKNNVVDFKEEEFIELFLEHAKEGVDFMTLHVSITKDMVEKLKKSQRLMKIVSRGGSIIGGWIIKNKKENPFYKYFDEILDIANEYDVTLSLGDSLRPGNIYDSLDSLQLEEWFIFEELVEKARRKNVQVILEGPGHVPLDQIETTVKLMKKYGKNSPIYLLGPLPFDFGVPYDHILSSIGAAFAGYYGADFICYVTPSEHVSIPDEDDVKMGVLAAKIAAISVDIMKGKYKEKNKIFNDLRLNMDFESMKNYVIDKDKFESYVKRSKIEKDEGCSMCGPFCAIKIFQRFLENKNSENEKYK
ncbi:MAG: phosphomethylpyrimidine synthase ThiC [Spirochaetes bacterium]|nr:phosphomethylpyrimidine synthase ThiC [Spirochaetota bacterium]